MHRKVSTGTQRFIIHNNIDLHRTLGEFLGAGPKGLGDVQ